MASRQFDVVVNIHSAKDLMNADWVGLSDPYVVMNFNGHSEYKTRRIDDNLNPVWDDHVRAANVPEGATINFHVYDQGSLTEDDHLGSANVELLPQDENLNGSAWEWESTLPLLTSGKGQGELLVKIRCTLSTAPGEDLLLTGPVRYRRHTRLIAGLLTENPADFHTYKVFLLNTKKVFDGQKAHWNTDYPAAQNIFSKNILGVSTMQVAINLQHQKMYACDQNTVFGVMDTGADFLRVLKNGIRDGEQRYYTYVIQEDSMRFSETGAAFFKDMLSKHAMHSSAAEEVYYAGEFTIEPSTADSNSLGYKLCIDNNSGTYAPPKERLPLLHDLLQLNFPDLEIEVLDRGDEQMKVYHSHCPSR